MAGLGLGGGGGALRKRATSTRPVPMPSVWRGRRPRTPWDDLSATTAASTAAADAAAAADATAATSADATAAASAAAAAAIIIELPSPRPTASPSDCSPRMVAALPTWRDRRAGRRGDGGTGGGSANWLRDGARSTAVQRDSQLRVVRPSPVRGVFSPPPHSPSHRASVSPTLAHPMDSSPPSQNRHAPLMYAFPLFLPPSQWCQPQIPKHYLRLTRVHVVAHKLHPHAPASHHR